MKDSLDVKPKADKQTTEPTSLERMKELTRRIIQVPKSEALKPKRRKPNQP